MELVLQKDLKHQEDGVKAVSKVFANVYIEKPNTFYSNPIINLEDKIIEENIIQIKNDNSIEDKNIHPTTEGYLSLDVKMETGTGKTYVYTKTIFELNKKYGFNKFIIAVPSLAIKSGTAHFISDGYVKRHFKDVCEYNKEISLGILSSQRSKKKKKYFPSVVDDFVKGSIQNSNKIYVLLINMQLISERKDNLLNIDNYDYSVAGFYRPYDALAATKPILIIDEPHRFATDKTTIPIKQLHKALCKYDEKYGNSFSQKLNRVSISNFIEKYSEWKANNIQCHFKYMKCDTKIGATALTKRDGTVKKFITQCDIGTKIDEGTPTEKYLYEKFAYDSELEHKNIITGIDSVVVYGKIPRRSIKIPTFVGNNETYSPDFMYIVKRNNNEKDLNLIVETKDVKSENDLRGNEKQKIKCAEVFFENLSKDGYNVTFKRQINNKDMRNIIEEILKQ